MKKLPITVALFATALSVGAEVATVAPKNAPARASAKIEAEPADAPFTLQGFFGNADDHMVSLRDKSTGKSAWVSPGRDFCGWTLEIADTRKGLAILSKGSRRISLRPAAEIPGGPDASDKTTGGGKLSELEKTESGRRVLRLINNPKYRARITEIARSFRERLRIQNPQLFDKNGSPSGSFGMAFMDVAQARMLLAPDDSPDSKEIGSLLDSLGRTPVSIPLSIDTGSSDTPEWDGFFNDDAVRIHEAITQEKVREN